MSDKQVTDEMQVTINSQQVAQLKAKYGDKVNVEDVVSKAIRLLMEVSKIPEDVLSGISEAQDTLQAAASIVKPIKNYCESINKAMKVLTPAVATSAIGDSIMNMQQKAKENIVKRDIGSTKVQVGMSSTTHVPASSAKPLDKPMDKTNVTTPGTKITNELIGSAPSPEVAKELSRMRKEKKPILAHPSSVIGPDMGNEVSIQR